MSFALNPFISFGTQNGGGGGATSAGRITVGSVGADYTTINNALAAGHKVMAVINDVTEVLDVSVPSPGLFIEIDPGAYLNMGSGYFNVSDRSLEIKGNGRISYNYSDVNTILFNGSGVTPKLTVGEVTIINNSPAASCITDINYARFYNVVFEGNVNICSDANVYEGCIWRFLNINIKSGADNTILDGSVFETVSVSDSGINTVISDTVVY